MAEVILSLNVDYIQQQAHLYLASLQAFLRRNNIPDIFKPPVDHLAFKARDGVEFEKYLELLQPMSSSIGYIWLNGRRIATATLYSPIYFDELGTTNLLEVIEPKPENMGKSLIGFEHIEIFHPDLDLVRQRLEGLGVPFEMGGNIYHQTLVLSINCQGQEIKFTNKRLADLMRKQIKTGAMSVEPLEFLETSMRTGNSSLSSSPKLH